MTIVVFLSVLFISTQVIDITCNRVVYIYIVIIFVIAIRKKKTHNGMLYSQEMTCIVYVMQ